MVDPSSAESAATGTADIGVLHPGAMGASVIAALAANSHSLWWCAEGRGPATSERAMSAGAQRCETLPELTEKCEVLICVCPPENASATAEAVLAAGFNGLYVDANAVSPARAQELSAGFGSRYVDGGIIGPPAWRAGTTRLYLSGARADEVVALFAGSPLEPIAMAQAGVAASALKMCYAAWTKGNSALLLSVAALAEQLAVRDVLEEEWGRSQPGTQERAEKGAGAVAPKAWRFAGEMREISETYGAAGLPAGFHGAAGEFYERLSGFKDQQGVSLLELLAELQAPLD